MKQDLDRILLGDNSFIGVDHLSQERAREKGERLNTARIIDTIDAAFENGATGLVCATHPTMYSVLEEMNRTGYDRKFGYYLIFPYTQGYVQAATEKGIMGLVSEIYSKLGWVGATKSFAKGGLAAIRFDPFSLIKSGIDIELGSYINVKPKGAKLQAVFLHEVFTELMLSFAREDIARLYIDHVESKYNTTAGFVTRNFVRFVEFCEKYDLPLDRIVIMSPFNKVGFQMTPTESACRETLSRLNGTRVIAMSPMAAGYVPLDEAVEYIKQLPNSPSVVMGTSRKEHAQVNFSLLRRSL